MRHFAENLPTIYKKGLLYRVKNCKNIYIVADQIVRGARSAFGGPGPSVNLRTHLHAQGVNSRMKFFQRIIIVFIELEYNYNMTPTEYCITTIKLIIQGKLHYLCKAHHFQKYSCQGLRYMLSLYNA